MKNPLVMVKDNALDILESLKVGFSEIRKSRKYEHSQKCQVLLVYDTGMGEWHQGLTDETGNYLFVPLLMRVWNELHPVIVSPEERIFLVHNDNHCTLDLILLGKIAASCTYDMVIDLKVTERLRRVLMWRWQHNTDVVRVKVRKAPATINPQLFKNRYSQSFSVQNFNVLQSKTMEFLQEPSQRTIIMIAIISCLIGSMLGAIFSLIAYLLIGHYT